jgi:integrase
MVKATLLGPQVHVALGNALPRVSATRETYKTGRDALTPDEVTAVLAHVTSYPDEFLLRLAIATGIRREDLVRIQVHDVDAAVGTIGFWESKKRRPWKVHLSEEMTRRLTQHVSTLPPKSQYLFPTRQSGRGHISGKTAWNVLDRALKAAGLAPRPFHALRATCIKLAQKKGWTPEQVSELTGDTIRTIQTHYSTPSHDEMSQVAKEKAIL